VGGLSYDLGRTGGGTWGLYSSTLMRDRKLATSRPGTTTQFDGVTGFGLQYRTRPSLGGLYFGGGIGTYSLTTSVINRDGNTTSTTTTEESTWGGKVFVGKNITSRVFAEAAYTKVNAASLGTGPSRDLSHGALTLGYRF
jgi:hypothetical protein